MRIIKVGGIVSCVMYLADLNSKRDSVNLGLMTEEKFDECLKDTLSLVEDVATKYDLDAIAERANGIRRRWIDQGAPMDQVLVLCRDLVGSIQEIMYNRRYIELSAEEQKLFDTIPLHDKGQTAFPSARDDLREASKCFALMRSTSCVFHCMRSFEIALKALAAELQVTPSNPNWGNILRDLEIAVKAITTQGKSRGSNWKQDEQFYSEAIADFRIFKNAWRNYVTYSSVFYTADQAREIMDRTRSFIEHLSSRISEPT